MHLQLRPDPKDRRTMVMTDHAGRPLPNQTRVIWGHGGPDELAEATITFAIDGERVSVVEDMVETGNGTLPEALAAFGRLSPANKLRFIEAARPHPLDPAFASLNAVLEALRDVHL